MALKSVTRCFQMKGMVMKVLKQTELRQVFGGDDVVRDFGEFVGSMVGDAYDEILSVFTTRKIIRKR